jgi:hypothetical protein
MQRGEQITNRKPPSYLNRYGGPVTISYPMARPHGRSARVVLPAVALTGILLIGVLLRLQDPLGTTVLPGIDPFRHMAFTMSFLEGNIADYPPGLHALMAAIWAYTGAELYTLYRFGPVLLGAIGIIGMGLLLWRHLGPVPALIGSLGYAVLPAFIRYSTKLVPTAIDMALAPLLFYAVLEMLRGRISWTAVTAVLVLFLMFTHPWFYALLAVVLVLFIGLSLLFERPDTPSSPLNPKGIALLVAILGSAFWLMMSEIHGASTRTTEFMPDLFRDDRTLWTLLALSFVPLALQRAFPSFIDRTLHRLRVHPLPSWTRLATSATIAAGVLVVTYLAVQQGLPRWVDPPGRFGWPALALGAFALVSLPFLGSRLALLAATFVIVTYPLAMFDWFDVYWLPSRIVYFLGIGLIPLVAVAGKQIHDWTRKTITQNKSLARAPLHRTAALILPVVLVTGGIGGTLYITAPQQSDWYRLYDECETDALRSASAIFNEDPQAVVLTSSEKSQRVIQAFTDHGERIWNHGWWLREYEENRYGLFQQQEAKNAPIFLVIEPRTRANISFLQEPPWQERGAWCHDEDGEPTITVHSSGPMYTRCQTDAFKAIAGRLNEDPEAMLITGSWQAKTVLEIHQDDHGQSWAGGWWMQDYETYRYEMMQNQRDKGAPLYLLIDPYTHHRVGEDNLTFLQTPDWQPIDEHCPDDHDRPTLRTYQMAAEPGFH